MFCSSSTGTICTFCKLKGIVLSAAEIVVEGNAFLDKNSVVVKREVC